MDQEDLEDNQFDNGQVEVMNQGRQNHSE